MGLGGVDDYDVDLANGTMTQTGARDYAPAPDPQAPPASPELALVQSGMPPVQVHQGPSTPQQKYGASPNAALANQFASWGPAADARIAATGVDPNMARIAYARAGGGGGDYGLGAAQSKVGKGEKAETEAEQDYIDAAKQNAEDQVKAAESANKVAVNTAEAKAKYDITYQQQMQAHAEQQAKEVQTLQDTYGDKRKDVERLVADASSAHVDPDAARGNMGHRAIAGLAIALGAMGSAYTGGPNVASQIVSKQIEDELDAQKSNIANKWRNVEAGKSSLADLRQQLGDSRAADSAFRAQSIQQRLDYLNSMDMKSAPDLLRANHQKVVADLTQQKDAAIHDASTRSAKATIESGLHSAQIGGERGRLAMEGKRMDIEQERNNIAASEKAAKADPKAAETMDLISQLKKLKDLGDEGYAAPGTERSHEAETRLHAAQAALMKHTGIKRNKDLIEGMLGYDVTGIRGGKAKAQIDTMIDILQGQLKGGVSGGSSDDKDPGEEGAAE